MQSSSVFKALAILLCTVAVASSLKCYVCNSAEHKGCLHGKDVESQYLIDCKDASPTLGGNSTVSDWKVCRKIITWVDFDVNTQKGGEERILRRCGYDESKYPDGCFYRGGLGGRQRVCSCKTDDCNSAPKMTMTNFFSLSLIPVFIYFKFQ